MTATEREGQLSMIIIEGSRPRNLYGRMLQLDQGLQGLANFGNNVLSWAFLESREGFGKKV